MHKIKCLTAALLLLMPAALLQAQSFRDRLEAIPQVKEITKLESKHFAEKYLVLFEQPVDHKDPSAGTFNQRVFVCNVHPDSMTVLVTEGYGAQYGAYKGYREELSRLFNTNNIVVEHRYFLNSTPYPGVAPENVDWSHLTAENSANDLHNVVEAFRSIYKGKWISTGISKGGQTSTLFRTFFPDDVDVSVPYVAPLCRAAEDGRHEPFIADKVATPEERQKVKDFQIEFIKRRETLQPIFDSLCDAKGYEFNAPKEEIYDYCMLEFPFALWQWGTPVSSIPPTDASDREIFNYMMRISSPDYFRKWCSTSEFFVQAAKELGYYGYDLKQFKKYRKYLRVKNTKGYLHKLLLPQNGEDFKFDPTLYHKISAFLLSTDARMLYIYGAYDPWTSVKVPDPHKENIKIYIRPKGSHGTRISSFSDDVRKEIMDTLSGWLYD